MLWCIQKIGWKEDWYEAMMPPTMPWIELCGDSSERLRWVEKAVVACAACSCAVPAWARTPS